MTPLTLTLALRSPLGTPLVGDTLFGQLCVTARDAWGDAELVRLLEGYRAGSPWLVVGDGFPVDYLPRPTLPPLADMKPEDRKAAKGKRWIPLAAAALPLPELLAAACNDEAVFGKDKTPVATRAHHNTLNRISGTTGTGEFAPYTMAQTHYAVGQRFDIRCVLDESRCDMNRLRALFETIGITGFGRDASIGLGKFDLISEKTAVPPASTFSDAYWTLGPCAPQGQGFDGDQSYWRVLTRFGRHGGARALGGQPFKNPVLLAAAGAVLVPQAGYTPRLFVGQGLGGVSHAEANTVHQGYAPVLPVQRNAS